MRSFLRWISTAGLALGVVGTAHAQQSTRIELGVDAALTHISFDFEGNSSSSTTFDFPVQALRAGFELSPLVSIEPSLGIHTVSGDGSFTQLTFDVGLPVNLSGALNLATTQYFIRPLVGFRHFSASGESGQTQTAFGVGLGLRAPMTGRLVARLEARYAHGLHSDNIASSNEFGLLAGVSYFTR
jgi:opacity protein-like surface antigen